MVKLDDMPKTLL